MSVLLVSFSSTNQFSHGPSPTSSLEVGWVVEASSGFSAVCSFDLSSFIGWCPSSTLTTIWDGCAAVCGTARRGTAITPPVNHLIRAPSSLPGHRLWGDNLLAREQASRLVPTGALNGMDTVLVWGVPPVAFVRAPLENIAARGGMPRVVAVGGDFTQQHFTQGSQYLSEIGVGGLDVVFVNRRFLDGPLPDSAGAWPYDQSRIHVFIASAATYSPRFFSIVGVVAFGMRLGTSVAVVGPPYGSTAVTAPGSDVAAWLQNPLANGPVQSVALPRAVRWGQSINRSLPAPAPVGPPAYRPAAQSQLLDRLADDVESSQTILGRLGPSVPQEVHALHALFANWSDQRPTRFTDPRWARNEGPDWVSAHLPNWVAWMAVAQQSGSTRIGEVGIFTGVSQLALTQIGQAWVTAYDGVDIGEGLADPTMAERVRLCEANRWAHSQMHWGPSQVVMPLLYRYRDARNETYALWLIDGSHMADDTFLDAEYAWRMLADGGVIIFDDYEYTHSEPLDGPQAMTDGAPRRGVHAFLALHGDECRILEPVEHIHQLAIQKVRGGRRLIGTRSKPLGGTGAGLVHGATQARSPAFPMPLKGSPTTALEYPEMPLDPIRSGMGYLLAGPARANQVAAEGLRDLAGLAARGNRDNAWAGFGNFLYGVASVPAGVSGVLRGGARWFWGQ